MKHTTGAAALNWDDLRIALAIAENGTISGAAAQLRISHPTLSRRLQLIERRLGTRLFERTPSSLKLTAAARRHGSRPCVCAKTLRRSSAGSADVTQVPTVRSG